MQYILVNAVFAGTCGTYTPYFTGAYGNYHTVLTQCIPVGTRSTYTLVKPYMQYGYSGPCSTFWCNAVNTYWYTLTRRSRGLRSRRVPRRPIVVVVFVGPSVVSLSSTPCYWSVNEHRCDICSAIWAVPCQVIRAQLKQRCRLALLRLDGRTADKELHTLKLV